MSLKFKAVINIVGRVWAAAMSFAFVPLYIHFLGVEAYGLIGFGVTILAVFLALDLGLGTAINRELARMRVDEDWQGRGGTLLRTLEVVYWSTAVVIGGIIIASAPLIAGYWLNTSALDASESSWAIRMLGVSIVMRWPAPLYVGALMGLDKQLQANAVTAGAATLTSGGAAVILWIASPSVISFFIWQAASGLVQVVILRQLVWRSIPTREKSMFAVAELVRLARFSVGLTGIAALSLFLTQSDKLLLSKILPLEEFGYYALASSIAGALSIAAIGIYNAVLPSFSSAIKAGRTQELSRSYHHASQALAVIIFPTVFTIVMFSHVLLTIYTSNSEIADNAYIPLAILSAGNGLLAMMLLPLALQLAHGWTSLSVGKNLIAVPIFVPVLWWLTAEHGAMGASIAWLALTLGYLAFEPAVMHAKVLKGEMRTWYLIDVGLPMLAAMSVVGLFRAMIPPGLPLSLALAWVGCCGLSALTAAALAAPYTRALISGFLQGAVRRTRQ